MPRRLANALSKAVIPYLRVSIATELLRTESEIDLSQTELLRTESEIDRSQAESSLSGIEIDLSQTEIPQIGSEIDTSDMNGDFCKVRR